MCESSNTQSQVHEATDTHFIASCGHGRFGWLATTMERHLISSCDFLCDFPFIVISFSKLHRGGSGYCAF
jgi:hypothetical protein